MKYFDKKLKAFSLVELILAIGIFTTVSSMLILLIVDATKTLDNTKTRSKATNLVQEINSALLLLKDQSWQNIAVNTNDGEKHLQLIDGSYQIADGPGTHGDFTYSFTITSALRDEFGNLVDLSGSLDPHTRVISISILWNDSLGREHTIAPKMYLNDWNTHSLIDTTVEDFTLGVHDGTYVENISGGEISLETMLYSDWCRPNQSMLTYDLPGQGVASSISTFDTTVLMGTGGNASGMPFIKATVTEEPASISIDDSYSTSDKVNDVYLIDENYSLLATDTGGEQVMIMNMVSPITKVGYVTLESQAKATTVSAYQDMGFVTERNNLIKYDLTTFTGSRTILETVSLGGNKNKTTATDIYVDENYVYLTLREHTNEFVIYEHTPTLNLVGQIDFGDVNATALFISEDKTKAFLGTENNTGHEYFMIDITNKESTYTVTSSLDLNGMSVNALISIDGRVMIGGQGGQEYQVINIDDMSNPVTCGALTVGTPVNDISLVQTATSNYSYIVTGDSNRELQIIRGGLGGGGADGDGYLPTGEFISQLFDTNSSVSEYYIISLQSTVPTGTSIQLQLRANDTSDIAAVPWQGPDGTDSTYYEGADIYNIGTELTGRYFQYRAILNSELSPDSKYDSTPLLEEFTVNYEK